MATASNPTTNAPPKTKLKKELKLFDVYAICTGAMFSSGFFLLPGLAAAQTGPSVSLAYLISGILMLPAMFSMAELATAMPRAGGDYYFLDRAMGPLIGTIGGIGTYLALTLKSAFALIGMGAYLGIFFNVPIQPLAIGLTIAFMLLNFFGAKETTSLQRILVTVLVAVMAVFLVGGVYEVFQIPTTRLGEEFSPFLTNGIAGLLGTVGFVFVSYAGLTKIASVSEEVVNPGRNIPLGMILSIVSTTMIYVVGVLIMSSLLDADVFRSSLTPVADAAAVAMAFLPGEMGVLLVVASAVAAFASTGNAGILAASRYPLAMGRDRLIPPQFARITDTGTPGFSIFFTSGLMIFAILVLDESTIAKVASTFQLIIFMLINLSVIVMRESKIEYYDPIYRSPFYPWMQIAGIIASIFLLSYIGIQALAMTAIVIVASILWYQYYANNKVERHGAVYHWFSRLGELRYTGLEHELREILKEKGVRDEDPFDEIIDRAQVIDVEHAEFGDLCEEAAILISQQQPLFTIEHGQGFIDTVESNYTLAEYNAAIPSLRLPEISAPQLVIIRIKEGLLINQDAYDDTAKVTVYALFFLVSPDNNPGQHLRILAQLAKHIETERFTEDWLRASDAQELKEILLHDERVLTLWLNPDHPTESLIGKKLYEVDWRGDTLVAIIRRDGREIIPHGHTELFRGDRVTIIGSAQNIQWLFDEYVAERPHNPA
ncbi:MAG: amino acid permease [Anaerolineae bacterium]